MNVYTAIFKIMSTLSPDPGIAYFEAVWYKKLGNKHEKFLWIDDLRSTSRSCRKCQFYIDTLSGTHL